MDSRTTTVCPACTSSPAATSTEATVPWRGAVTTVGSGSLGTRPVLGGLLNGTGVRTRFADRRDAGRQLAEPVAALGLDRPLVIALPRGGVPVAAEVAPVLDAPLDVLVVRKLGLPDQPELALGAIAEGGAEVVDRHLARLRRVSRGGARRACGPRRWTRSSGGSAPTAGERRRRTRRDGRS